MKQIHFNMGLILPYKTQTANQNTSYTRPATTPHQTSNYTTPDQHLHPTRPATTPHQTSNYTTPDQQLHHTRPGTRPHQTSNYTTPDQQLHHTRPATTPHQTSNYTTPDQELDQTGSLKTQTANQNTSYTRPATTPHQTSNYTTPDQHLHPTRPATTPHQTSNYTTPDQQLHHTRPGTRPHQTSNYTTPDQQLHHTRPATTPHQTSNYTTPDQELDQTGSLKAAPSGGDQVIVGLNKVAETARDKLGGKAVVMDKLYTALDAANNNLVGLLDTALSTATGGLTSGLLKAVLGIDKNPVTAAIKDLSEKLKNMKNELKEMIICESLRNVEHPINVAWHQFELLGKELKALGSAAKDDDKEKLTEDFFKDYKDTWNLVDLSLFITHESSCFPSIPEVLIKKSNCHYKKMDIDISEINTYMMKALILKIVYYERGVKKNKVQIDDAIKQYHKATGALYSARRECFLNQDKLSELVETDVKAMVPDDKVKHTHLQLAEHIREGLSEAFVCYDWMVVVYKTQHKLLVLAKGHYFNNILKVHVLKSMKDYRLDILGISEMRWTGQGRLMVDGATVLYSGKQDHHTHGVGIILSSYAAKALVGWKPVNERIITARLYTRHAKATIVQVYAPTDVASEEDKDAFYNQLQTVLEEIPSYDIKMLIGDFNAKLDDDRRGLNTTVGPHGSASSTNDNGERLLMLTSTNGFSIGNTFFGHKRIHKMTWVSPGGGTRNELDYICINTRWCSSLLDVRSYRGADVGSDHFLVVGKIRLKLKKVEKVQPKRPYAVDKLKNNNVSESFREELSKKLAVPQHPSTIEEQWSLFSRTITETAEAVLGRRGTNKERWITDHTWKLIDERKVAKIKREQKRRLRSWRMEDEEYRRLDREVKKSCRNDKRRWLEEKAREAQEAAEKNNTKTL
ncbi:Craniofacial development protein 2 [Merluccius polli]|uniref:Craniofacial development protein 2 n=1 Tax=Merluccius polli TaxID=89951 RepID=A0AA47M7A7_MERPO|nr:Craniofacial development protein 2 [Merluccius polli]